MLELAVLDGDGAAMMEHLSDALAQNPYDWQLETTLRNVDLLNASSPSSVTVQARVALRNSLGGR